MFYYFAELFLKDIKLYRLHYLFDILNESKTNYLFYKKTIFVYIVWIINGVQISHVFHASHSYIFFQSPNS